MINSSISFLHRKTNTRRPRCGVVLMEYVILGVMIAASIVFATQMFGDAVVEQFSLMAKTAMGSGDAGAGADQDQPDADDAGDDGFDGPGASGDDGGGFDQGGIPDIPLPLPGLNSLEPGQTVEISLESGENGPFKRVTVSTGVSGLAGVGLQNPILNEVGGSEVTMTFEVGADSGYTGDYDGGLVGVGGEIYAGGNLTYSVTMPESAYEAIRDGSMPPPLLSDPTTWPIGAQVLVTGEAVAGTSMEASYRAFMIENGIEESAGLVVGMTRLDDGTMRMYIGDTESVSQHLFTGIGNDDFKLGIGNDTQLRDSTLHFRDIDIHHPDANNPVDLLHTATFGAENNDALTNSGQVELLTFTSATSIEAQLGPIGGSLELGENGGRAMVITHDDGSQDIEFFTSYHTGQGTLSQSTVDADGNMITQSGQYYDTLAPNSEVYAHLSLATGDPYAPPANDATVQINITPAFMNELSERYAEAYSRDEFIVHAAGHLADFDNSSQLDLGSPDEFLALMGRGLNSSDHLASMMSAIVSHDEHYLGETIPFEHLEYEFIEN